MKRFIGLIAILALLAIPCMASAGTLVIDWENASSGTTTIASGSSTYTITAISGTYTTSLGVGDTVIPNLSFYGGVWTIQINTSEPSAGATTTMSFIPYVEFSTINDADHWAGASRYYLPLVAYNSGASLYARSIEVKGFEFARVGDLSGTSPHGRTTIRSVLK